MQRPGIIGALSAPFLPRARPLLGIRLMMMAALKLLLLPPQPPPGLLPRI